MGKQLLLEARTVKKELLKKKGIVKRIFSD